MSRNGPRLKKLTKKLATPNSPFTVPTNTLLTIYVEQRSRADFASDFAPDSELPLSKLTATDNIMLGDHDQ
jgi:hypothetical protein